MKKVFIAFGVLAMPFAASAQNYQGNLTGLVMLVGRLVNLLLPIVSTLVIAFFFWGLAKFVLAAGDEEKAREGKSIMVWGAIALFVMATIWGIIAFMQRTIGNTDSAVVGNIVIPNFNPSQVRY